MLWNILGTGSRGWLPFRRLEIGDKHVKGKGYSWCSWDYICNIIHKFTVHGTAANLLDKRKIDDIIKRWIMQIVTKAPRETSQEIRGILWGQGASLSDCTSITIWAKRIWWKITKEDTKSLHIETWICQITYQWCHKAPEKMSMWHWRFLESHISSVSAHGFSNSKMTQDTQLKIIKTGQE